MDIIDGIEHDLAVSFVNYLKDKYEVDLELQWIETDSFDEVMETVRKGKGGTFGASSISITPQRSQYLNFTKPYMPDIAVLVSSADIPVALSEFQMGQVLTDKTAVSIKNTTLEDALYQLQQKLSIQFDIEFTGNSGDILDKIDRSEGSFGYVDIANFLVAVENNANVKRQLFFPVKLEGLAFVFPKNSDWADPVNDYFNSDSFKNDCQKVITRYLGSNASEIINRISKSAEIGPLEEIVLSNREKEAQYQRLLEAARRDRDSARLRVMLTAIIIVVLVILILVYVLYRIKSINNQKLLEQSKLVEHTNEQLRTLNEEKNNLIQVLAHDLRSPLSNILGGAQILESNENVSEEGKKILGFIIQSSEKMASLIGKILDVDAIETGKHNVKAEYFHAAEIIHKVIMENAHRARKKFIDIVTDVSDDIVVIADKIYLAQVIENLITNAIKYSPVNSKVHVTAEEDRGMVRISISDHGPGLSDEDQERLFKKYQLLSTRPTEGESSIGLGLSIVKLFTERMGGEVKCETKLGKGTTFHVFLKKG